MGETSIEWVTRNGVQGYSWNPWWGCQRVSPGCGLGKSVGGCYAETFSKRLGLKIWGPQAPRRHFGSDHWNKPRVWHRKAARERTRPLVFCASMADVFEDRDDLLDDRAALFKLIGDTPRLIWLLLTKRPQNIKRMVPWGDRWPENVWIGTTVEDQKRADERIPILLDVPARVRFLSCEPLLERVDLKLEEWNDPCAAPCGVEPSEIHWVIVGGESGHGARPMHDEWVRFLRDQCSAAGVSFFFKQRVEGRRVISLPLLDGRRHDAFPT